MHNDKMRNLSKRRGILLCYPFLLATNSLVKVGGGRLNKTCVKEVKNI